MHDTNASYEDAEAQRWDEMAASPTHHAEPIRYREASDDDKGELSKRGAKARRSGIKRHQACRPKASHQSCPENCAQDH